MTIQEERATATERHVAATVAGGSGRRSARPTPAVPPSGPPAVAPTAETEPAGLRAWLRRLAEHRLLGTVLVLFTLSTVVWDLVYRRGQLYDIDESGYLGISLLDFRSLGTGGLLGWYEQIVSPSIQSPLTTALTTPVYLVFGPSPVAALLVPLGFTLVAIAATYGLARRTGGVVVARWATVLMASAPVIVNYSRDYHFAAGATAVTTVALYCLARSEGLASRPWTAAFGVMIGLLPLARTMTVAFIPGFVVAVAVLLCVGGQRGRKLVNTAIAAVLAVGVAATWLGANGNAQTVWSYLTGYGYGSASSAYGTSHPLYSYAAWQTTLQTLSQYTRLPHLVVLLAGGLAILAVVARFVASAGGVRRVASAATLRRVAQAPVLPALVVVGVGLVALTSSANQGSAFVAPLVPAMCVLAVWALRSAFRAVPWPVATALGAVAVVAVVPTLPIPWALAGTWTVTVPQLGPVAVTSGQGVIQQFVQGATDAQTERDPQATATGRQWLHEQEVLAADLQARYGNRALVAFGFRHRLFNVNSVNLAPLAAGGSQLPLVLVPREVLDDSADAYASWLHSGSAARACLLFTASGTENEFVPLVTGTTMAEAAVEEGFERTREWSLPDGRVVTEWKRAESCPS